VVSVAVPTVDHHRVAKVLIEAGKDVLVEKPIAASLAEADDLIRLAGRRGVTLQVGHIERFNPATEVLRAAVVRPRFIEVHRLGSFSPRSLDIDVVLDLMIHDLDIVLALDGSEPVQVDAVGVPVLTPRVDIANARLRFASGLIANLTASRVSAERVRKFRVFLPRTYVSVDFAAREASVYRLLDGPAGPDISVQRTSAPDEEPLRRQLDAFLAASREKGEPIVSGTDGRRALALAQRILEQMTSSADSP
jgi:predicted dehydrogenase